MIKDLCAFASIMAFVAMVATVTSLPACDYEDSTNCAWRADIAGNGQGTSFVDINGNRFTMGD